MQVLKILLADLKTSVFLVHILTKNDIYSPAGGEGGGGGGIVTRAGNL